MSRQLGYVCAALLCALSISSAFIQVDVNNQQFQDEEGRVRIFHGVNAVFKKAPFYPTLGAFDPRLSLNDQDMANLHNYGFNAIRLGVLWEAVETSPGVYNQTYLDVMSNIVNRLGSHGIYTIVDAHQDSMCRKYCGEGIPVFHCNPDPSAKAFPYPLPVHIEPGPDGYPNQTECEKVQFELFTISAQEASTWKNLFENSTLHTAFAGFWGTVAATFKDNPYVLGYELLNEPWFGDVYKDPQYGLDNALADAKNLQPMYDAAYAAIRAADPNHIVFYEPTVTEPFLHQVTGLEAPGGVAQNGKQSLAMHMYCYGQNATGDITNVASCEKFLDDQWEVVQKSSAKVGGGLFITEFGAVGPHESSAEAITHLANIVDAKLGSWAYWTFKSFDDITTQNAATESFYNDDGSLQTLKIAALTRTYAQAIAGRVGSPVMSFDAATGRFQLQYIINEATRSPTEIFASQLHYPNGLNVTAFPSDFCTVTVNASANSVVVSHPPNVSSSVEIIITPLN